MKIIPNEYQFKVGDWVKLSKFDEIDYPYIGYTPHSMDKLVGKEGMIEAIIPAEDTEGDGIAYDVLSRLWPAKAVKLVKKHK